MTMWGFFDCKMLDRYVIYLLFLWIERVKYLQYLLLFIKKVDELNKVVGFIRKISFYILFIGLVSPFRSVL